MKLIRAIVLLSSIALLSVACDDEEDANKDDTATTEDTSEETGDTDTDDTDTDDTDDDMLTVAEILLGECHEDTGLPFLKGIPQGNSIRVSHKNIQTFDNAVFEVLAKLDGTNIDLMYQNLEKSKGAELCQRDLSYKILGVEPGVYTLKAQSQENTVTVK